MKKISLIFFITFSFGLFADEIYEFDCDQEIILIIDESTMTSDEIIKAKNDHFNKLLIQQNQDCIAQEISTTTMPNKPSNKGGTISGSEVKSQQVKKSAINAGSSLSTPFKNTSSLSQVNANASKQNATLKCFDKYKNDDEFATQLKEAISKTKDEATKKELIQRYAKYKGIKSEKLKC